MKAVWLIIFTVFFAVCAHAQEIPALAIIADQKLAVPLAEIARAYTQKERTAVSLAFISREEETALVAESAYTDLFITAHESWLEALRQQGVVDIHSGEEVARNHLVLAGKADEPLELSLKQGFPVAALVNAMQGEPRLLVGNPETLEEGSIARQALHGMDVSADLEPYTIYLKRFSQMMRLLMAQRSFALLYVSDVKINPELAVLGVFPERSYTPVIYRAAVLAGDKMEASRSFVRYLQSAQAQQVFKKYGMGK